MYLGEKTISRLGCFGCHNIPGFEDAKPIGTPLNGWGLKSPTKLDFAHIVEFLDDHRTKTDEGEYEYDGTDEYYHEKLADHTRTGFLFQKLHRPRCYDYKKTREELKAWDERLRMPQFSWADDPKAIEEVMTFILGLTGEKIAAKYLPDYNPTTQARAQGERLLNRTTAEGATCSQMPRYTIAAARHRRGDAGLEDQRGHLLRRSRQRLPGVLPRHHLRPEEDRGRARRGGRGGDRDRPRDDHPPPFARDRRAGGPGRNADGDHRGLRRGGQPRHPARRATLEAGHDPGLYLQRRRQRDRQPGQGPGDRGRGGRLRLALRHHAGRRDRRQFLHLLEPAPTPLDPRGREGPDPLADQLPARPVRDPARGQPADAEVPLWRHPRGAG